MQKMMAIWVTAATLLVLPACSGGTPIATLPPTTESLTEVSDQTETSTTPEENLIALAEGERSATVTSGKLNFTFLFGVSNARIVVGPTRGRVQVFGLPGITEGKVYNQIRAINWVSGTGDETIQFEVTQAADFDIAVDAGTGNVEIQTQWIIPAGGAAQITPSFSLKTGPGQKKLQMDLDSSAANVVFGLTTRFGAGEALFKGDLAFKQGSVNARGNIDLQFSGANTDFAELLIDNEATNLNLTIAPWFMKELVTKIVSDDPSSSTRTTFRPRTQSGGSKVLFEKVSAASTVAVNYGITGGAGADEITLGLNTLVPAQVTSDVTMALGQGNDKLDLKYDGAATLALSGPIQLEGGDDEAKLNYNGVTSYQLTLSCGAGIDKAVGFFSSTGCELN
ncbi:MAG: hypothetical protein OHK0012_10810 [Synechococcales cyanobacterium]